MSNQTNEANSMACSSPLSQAMAHVSLRYATERPLLSLFVGEIMHLGRNRYFPNDRFVIEPRHRIRRLVFTILDESAEATNGRLSPRILEPGYTILILYPKYVEVPGGGEGILIEQADRAKVLPFGINFFMRLDIRLDHFRSVKDGLRLCYGCHERKQVVHPCPRCKLFFFCNRDCQAVACNEGEHEIDCEILRDLDLALIFRSRWDRLSEFNHNVMKPCTMSIEETWKR
ncbi:hypothetical protein BJX70DRAFT_396126 [Aspergillus crustosus]